MRPIGLGLIAALIIAMVAPAVAMAAPKAPALPPVSKAEITQGMKDTPAIVSALNLPCQVTNARIIGKAPEDKKAGRPATSYYEVACAPGQMGFIVSQPVGGTPTSFTCIEGNTPPDGATEAVVPCRLPENADPKIPLASALKISGVDCVPEAVRGLGTGKAGTVMEVACQGSAGYILVAPAPFDATKKLEGQNCLAYDENAGGIKCVLRDKASRLAAIDKFNTDAKTGCAVKDRRFVGETQDRSNWYEVGCEDGKGFMIHVSAAGVADSTPCIKAAGLMGGCTLSNAREAATEQAALYTRLAKAAGSNCDVDHYGVFPPHGTDDIVELFCKDGSGSVGIFRAAGSKSSVYDCGRAPAFGYKCSAGNVAYGYTTLTADLKKLDKASCVVSDARAAGRAENGNVSIEVACADGFKGYIIDYKPDPVTPIAATGCALAGGCALPGNTKK